MKKLFAKTLATAMVLGVAGTPVLAETKDTDTVDVMYDNTSTIAPGGEENWAIKLPATVQFTDDLKTKDVSIEMVGQNGTVIENIDVKATVTVTSTNGLEMRLVNSEGTMTDGDDDIAYTVTYDSDQNMTGTNPLKLELNSKSKTSVKGQAVMTGSATKTGLHKDILTYSVALTE